MVPSRIFWMIAFVFSVVAVCGLLRDLGPLQSADGCLAACPCDTASPPLEAVDETLSPAGDFAQMETTSSVVYGVVVDGDGRLEQKPTDPCPLDCPECHCYMGHVLGAPPEVAIVVVALAPESLWLEIVFAAGEGSRSDLFRPPRGFPQAA